MMDSAGRLALYDRIYRAGGVVHPRKGMMAPYGAQADRDARFMRYLARVLPAGPGLSPRVLDASCGRGHLSHDLLALGYYVVATEVSPWLVEDLRRNLPDVRLLDYGRLRELREESFDAVVSNDVLEHLPEAEAVQAIDDLARLTRKHLLVSVGLGHGAVKYPEALGLGRVDLHLFCPGQERWEAEVARVARVVHKEATKKTLWLFAEVR